MENIEELLKKYKRYEMPELIQYLKQQQREEEIYQNVQKMIQKANGYDMLGIIKALTNTTKGKEYFKHNIEQFTQDIARESVISYIVFLKENFSEKSISTIRHILFEKCLEKDLPEYIKQMGIVEDEKKYIIEKCAEDKVPNLLEELYILNEEKYVKEHSKDIIHKCNSLYIVDLSKKWQKIDRELFEQNYAELLKKCLGRKLPELMDNTESIDLIVEYKEKLLEYMPPQNVPDYYKVLMKKNIPVSQEEVKIILQKTQENMVPILVEELQKQQGKWIQENISDIIQKCDPDSISLLIQVLKQNKKGQKIIEENFDNLLQKANADTILDCLEKVKDNLEMQKIFHERNYDFLLYLVKIIPKTEINESFFGTLIQNDKATLIKDCFQQFADKPIVEQDYASLIHFIDNGKNSYVFRLKDYAIKIGKQRKTYEIPYDENIRQPLFRMQDWDKENKNVILTVEVQRFTVNRKIPTKEEREALVKKLKERHIIAKDLANHAENAFYLDEGDENKMVIPKEDTSAGIIHYPDEKEDEGMKGGDVVLNDTDYLWRDDEEER